VGLLVKDRREDTQGTEGHMRMEAEIGVMCPQAKKHQDYPYSPEGRGEAGMASPSEPQKEPTHWHLDFRGLAFRTMREQIFILAI
jgi:hypothetical protein